MYAMRTDWCVQSSFYITVECENVRPRKNTEYLIISHKLLQSKHLSTTNYPYQHQQHLVPSDFTRKFYGGRGRSIIIYELNDEMEK